MDRAGVLILALACAVAGCNGGSSRDEPRTTLIAYTRYFPERDAGEVWTARLDGSGARRLVRGYAPSISPDGRWVAFFRAGDFSIFDRDLYAVPTQGGTPRLLVRKASAPVWSPNSDLIIAWKYDHDFGPGSLLRIDVETGETVGLVRGRAQYGWSFSPSGDEIVYGRGGAGCQSCRWGQRVDLYVIGVGGGAPRRLTYDGRSGFPVWGSNAIAFSRGIPYRGWGRDDIWLIEPDGSGRRALTGPLPMNLIGHGITGLEAVAWSEDGTRLLVGLANEFGAPPHAVDPRSGVIRKIGDFGYNAYAIGLSRDGRFVLVAEISVGGPDTDSRVAVASYRGDRTVLVITRAGSASWNR